jgi:hypothetical protein
VSAIAQSLIILACILSGALLGVVLRRTLPDRHLTADAKDVVRLGTGLVGTIAALVLGLLIAGAKTSYDTRSTQVNQLVASLILFDFLLAQYGPETTDIRKQARVATQTMAARIWSENNQSFSNAQRFEVSRPSEGLYPALHALTPVNDPQRILKEQASQAATEIARTRLLLFAEAQGQLSIPFPFLVVLVFWLTIIFASFSLFAEPNPIVIGCLFIFAVSAAGAIFLVIELADPFTGVMQISNEPLLEALPPLQN